MNEIYNEFKIGDVVVLKSGGPKMTVSEILLPEDAREISADCGTVWFSPEHADTYRDFFYFSELIYASYG